MVQFRTSGLKLHSIAQFEENRIIHKKMLNSSTVNKKNQTLIKHFCDCDVIAIVMIFFLVLINFFLS